MDVLKSLLLFRIYYSALVFSTAFFFRSDGYLITNGHVVQYANKKDLRAYGAQQDLIKRDAADVPKRLVAEIEKQTGKKVGDEDARTLFEDADVELVQGLTLTVRLANGQTVNGDLLQYTDPITQD